MKKFGQQAKNNSLHQPQSLESVRWSGYTAISSIWVTKKNRTPSWPQVAAIAPLGHSRWPTVSQNITSESLKTFNMLYDVCRSCIVVLSSTHRFKEYGVISNYSVKLHTDISDNTVTLYCIIHYTIVLLHCTIEF